MKYAYFMLAATLAAAVAPMPPEAARLHCLNPASGTEWDLAVDYAKRTVDQKAAEFTATDIIWHDSDAGPNYDFDRSSGVMTKTVASSTGGYIISDRCELH